MKPNKVAADVVVGLAYTLMLDDNEVIDEAEKNDPLFFLAGHNNIIPGLERALLGMAVGDTKRVVVAAVDGYGEYDDEEQDTLPRSIFPEDVEMVEGMPIDLRDTETDEVFEAMVISFDDETVTLDFNHPLAGETLFFEVTVVELRAATAEEIDHGHVHEV